MSKLRVKPAVLYCLNNSYKSIAIFIGIMVLIYLTFAFSVVQLNANNAPISLSAFEAAALIMIFIFGICAVRDDMRLLIQHGIGRWTAFITELIVAAALALILAVAGEVVIAITQAAVAGYDRVEIISLYQLLFNGGSADISFPQHIAAVFMNLSIYFGAYLAGVLISLVFYRLPKPWKVVVAVGAPVLFFIILPLSSNTMIGSTIISWLSAPIMRIADFAISNAGNYILVDLAVALVIGVCCRLLMRRVPIK